MGSRTWWNSLSRRDWLRASGLGLVGASTSGWLPLLADQQAADPRRKRHCILLWMNGGPSQLDTFDLKPGHANGGPYKPISTAASGVQWSEHLPQLAAHAQHMAVVRSLSTKEGDHGRGTHLMRTGHVPGGPIEYPSIGALVSKELGDETAELPNFVAISPYSLFSPAAYGPGFLGPRFAPATVGASQPGQNPMAAGYAELKLDDLAQPAGVDDAQSERRMRLWDTLEQNFLASRPSESSAAHELMFRRAARLMRSKAASAFDLSQEPAAVRDAYGRGRFGQGCLLARRLVERGVPFVEVSLGAFETNSVGWDTHTNNFDQVKQLSSELDAGWATLMSELHDRGLLADTTILWMGEFGRTPRINEQGGRDHFPNAWSCVLAGGGVRGGQAYGSTSEDGMTVADHQAGAADILATLCAALGIDPQTENTGDMGRPIKIAEGQPIRDLLA
ncbi:MAG: DUF1501 domain-containing protein [Pirellulales bacterium]